jgi:hypothetical protein
LEDLFGFFCGRGESESESELVADIRLLGAGCLETGGCLERLPPRLPTLVGLTFAVGGGESSEEVECSRRLK